MRILLVDDERNIVVALRRVLQRALQGEGVDIEIFDDPTVALKRAESTAFDLVISDFRMPQMNGVEFLKAFRQRQPDALRLVLSATTDFQTICAAVNEAEIHRYLTKPWTDEELIATVREALARRQSDIETEWFATRQKMTQGIISAEEYERRQLEIESPGITQVNWGPDGSVLIDDDDPKA